MSDTLVDRIQNARELSEIARDAQNETKMAREAQTRAEVAAANAWNKVHQSLVDETKIYGPGLMADLAHALGTGKIVDVK